MCFGFVKEYVAKFVTFIIHYAVLTGILAAAKIVPAFILLVQTLLLRNTVESYVNNTFDDPSMNKTFQYLEVMLKCCGTTGPEVYAIVVEEILYVPSSCCALQDGLTSTLCVIEDAYQLGCTTLIGEAVETWSRYLAYLLMFIIAGELVTLFVSLYIISTIKQKIK